MNAIGQSTPSHFPACRDCGKPIIHDGENWEHVGRPRPRHPAVPKGGEAEPGVDALPVPLLAPLPLPIDLGIERRRELDALRVENARLTAALQGIHEMAEDDIRHGRVCFGSFGHQIEANARVALEKTAG